MNDEGYKQFLRDLQKLKEMKREVYRLEDQLIPQFEEAKLSGYPAPIGPQLTKQYIKFSRKITLRKKEGI
jgi:hypothetical protein